MSTAEQRPLTAWSLFDGHRLTSAALALSAVVAASLEAVFLVIVTRAASAVAEGRDRFGTLAGAEATVTQGLIVAAGLVVVRTVISVIGARRGARLSTDISKRLQLQLSSLYLRSSWSVQQASPSGSLQNLITVYVGSAASVTTNTITSVGAALSLAALFGTAVLVNPLGSAIVVVALVALGSALIPLRRLVGARSKAATADATVLSTTIAETSALGIELHAFGVQAQAEERLRQRIDTGAASWYRLTGLRAVVPMVYSGLAYLALVGAVFGIAAVEESSVASLGPVMLLMLRSLTYGQQMQVAGSTIASERARLAAIDDELRRLSSGSEPHRPVAVDRVDGITLDGLGFSYDDRADVLRDITVTLRRGQMVGIVGPSGSGKSTLVQLLLGVRQPTHGRVLVHRSDGGDVDLTEVNRAHWVRRVAFVPQQPHLISATVADNIRFLRGGVTDDAVHAAAKAAHLHDEIVAHPDGYRRLLGNGGAGLSGGQAQRLTLARALVGTPDVVVLDEPTSALDARSEALVRATLEQLRTESLVVVIAHRMSTLDACDMVMVIQDGELRACGTPEQLRAEDEFYREALTLSGIVL